MKKNLLISTCFLFFLFVSCEKDNSSVSQPAYLVFGHYYGECIGEQCIEIFRLDQGRLFEDVKDQYPSRTQFYEGSFLLLDQYKYILTNDLMNYFPADLLNETNTVIGSPDAADGGGLYVECYLNGVRKFWLIDKSLRNVPTKYHAFIEKLNEKISLLK